MASKRNKNICRRIRLQEIYGRGMQSVNEVPLHCFDKESEIISEENMMLLHDLSLYEPSDGWSYLKLLLGRLQKNILKILLGTVEENSDESLKRKSETLIDTLCDFGLIEGLLDIMVLDLFQVRKLCMSGQQFDSSRSLLCPPEHIEEAKTIVQTVHTCMQMSRMTFHHLRWRHKLLEALFSLLAQSEFQVFIYASCVLEEIFTGSDYEPVKLENVAGLPDLIDRLDGPEQQAHFYHAICAFISDSDFVSSNNTTLEKHDEWLIRRCRNVVDGNQEFLLRHPRFLELICEAAGHELTNMRRSRELVVDILMQTLQIRDQPDLLSLIQRHLSGAEGAGLIYNMTLYKEKAFRADLFHVLTLLLTGKYRNEVQEKLVQCGFFTKLPSVAQSIVWEDLNKEILTQSSPSDDCNPDTFVRIQYLRLIHSIADNHSNRYHLLSISEFENLTAIAARKHLPLPDDLKSFDKSLLYSGEKGILTSILDRLKIEPATSLVRFWITRALEAFLRGTPCLLSQAFLIERKMIEDSVELLIAHKPKHEMIVQGVFDFLSTIMKFNLEGFQRFESVLDCSAKVIFLLDQVESHLVDSNMFIRCIVLTSHYLAKNKASCPDAQAGWESRLLKHFSQRTQLTKVAAELIKLLTVPTLSQENVSCLNTCLLILIFAHQDQEIHEYLAALSEMVDGEFLLTNLRSLLKFWRGHYTLYNKDMDRSNLETSTGVKFEEWIEVVEELLNNDNQSNCAIGHYLMKIAHTKSMSQSLRMIT
ncbi:short transient receptor potential channel 4-associated protein-like isoform X1 [Clavelina lepadiformis]|uniref:short transient receptor potential channel 4-associated protein-like isoform X1 n=2 Tax=Clavelina lepadiformis TaxID=159417 RepID=UPI0040414AFB